MKLAALALTCVALASTYAHAIPETRIASDYDSVLSYYESAGVSGEFEGVGGVRISYRKYEVANEKAALVIVNGRTETYLKYAEVIYDLRDQGYSIYLIDHRGQGYSGRMTKNPQLGYVHHFDDYVTDLETFMRTVVDARPHDRKLLLAHSMGGAIGALYLEKHPKEFAKAVLSAPMLEVDTGKFPEPVAYAISEAAVLAGQGKKLALGQKLYDPNAKFADNITTHSEARFAKMMELYNANPETDLGGPTYRWVLESLRGSNEAVEHASRVETPVLLIQAGQDKLVRPGGQNKFCARAKDCRKLMFADGFHESLMERDEIRDQAMSVLKNFLAD